MKFSSCLLTLILIGSTSQLAVADVVVTAVESNGNVEFEGNGSINLAGLTLLQSSSGGAVIRPELPLVSFSTGGFDVFTGVSGPDSYGMGSIVGAASASGDNFGITQLGGVSGSGPLELFIPLGYQSNDPLSSQMTFTGQSFDSLGMDEGTYVWSWGSGVDADTFTLNVGTAVPEPSSLALIGLFTGLLGCRRKRD